VAISAGVPSNAASDSWRPLLILLFALPVLVLGMTLVPPRALPHRMALAFNPDVRLSAGLCAVGVLFAEGVAFLLAH
jgi:hypothetical protein